MKFAADTPREPLSSATPLRYGRARPRVSFKVAPEPPARAGREIGRLLESGLRTGASPDLISRSWAMLVYPWWSRVLEIEGRSFAVVLTKHECHRHEWVALVGINDAPLGSLRPRLDIDYFPQLSRICRAIHATLVRTRWVSDVRWSFQKGRIQSPRVATPQKLPWDDTEHA